MIKPIKYFFEAFFIYLFLNDIFLNWLDFQRIPFVYLDSYGVSIFGLLKNFILFFLTEVPFNIGITPQYFVIFIIDKLYLF